MAKESPESTLQRIQHRISLFFPEQVYTNSMIEEALEEGDIFHKPTEILPYLQTALIDEKILEVEYDDLTRVFFSRLHDHPPQLEQADESGAIVIETDPDYVTGDYLKQMSHLITLPIEPGIGNLFIRHAKKIILRLFTASYAVELGTFFQELTEVEHIPVLRLDYPVIGRIVRGAREFRAKVPAKMELFVSVKGKRKQKDQIFLVKDISASGMSFGIEKNQQSLFRIDETRTLEISYENNVLAKTNGNVRHVSKIRGKKGTEFICGIQFDLVTRSVAAKIESIVALVQRAHLKEISELSESSGLELII